MFISLYAGSTLMAVALSAAMGSTAEAPNPIHGATDRSATDTADNAAIRRVLQAYNAALNGGSTQDVLSLYTGDGIFMPPYSPSAIGKAAVHAAYDAVFRELRFQVTFNVAELVRMAPTWAYVRTNSAGTTAHASTGKTTMEANQELFIFRKDDDGDWKIARYSFSPTNPPGDR